MNNLETIVESVKETAEFERTHQLLRYTPYEFQKEFHYAKGEGEFVCIPSDPKKLYLAIQRALMCANQIGKTYCGGMEMAMHLTGIYPEGWMGHRTAKPIQGLCASTTNETTRDRCQSELFGDPTDEDALGTGAIPKDCIGKVTRKAGVPNAYEIVSVRHVSGGWSKVYFKCYEQGPKKFMGYRLDAAWCDEEPPGEIWSQVLRSALATNGFAYITFTPEEGITEVVNGFMEDLQPGQALITATWDDAPHMTKEMQAQKLASLPPHEREMRSKGMPMVGSGLVFDIPDDDIICDPFDIPNYFPRIIGIDFGWDHPFAAAFCFHDRENDKFYIYDIYREKKALFPVVVDRLKRGHGDWIPIVWPHDGLKEDPKSGAVLADSYRDAGLNLHPDKFSNPPQPGQKEGQGGAGVEAGLHDMYTAMVEGRFKVFSTCKEWFDEKRSYYRKMNRKTGKVELVKLREDLISATRYAYMMRRHADTKITRQHKKHTRKGLSNW